MTFPPQMDGFDVYHGNHDASGHFPWEWSRGLGHELASFKAWEGNGTHGNGGEDPERDYNLATTEDCGFRWQGQYGWLKVTLDIASQIDFGYSVIGDLKPGQFVQLDMEETPPNYPRRFTIDEMRTAWELANQAWPFRVLMYSGVSYNGWVGSDLAGIPWWLPWYGRSYGEIALRLPWVPVVHQWGGGAEGMIVPGLQSKTGRADSNQVIRPDLLDALAGLGAPSTVPDPPIVVTPPPIPAGGQDHTPEPIENPAGTPVPTPAPNPPEEVDMSQPQLLPPFIITGPGQGQVALVTPFYRTQTEIGQYVVGPTGPQFEAMSGPYPVKTVSAETWDWYLKNYDPVPPA